MLLFAKRSQSVQEAKIAALKSMSVADLADIGLKPGDVARLAREIQA